MNPPPSVPKQTRGFTLIELLVVIAIVGILAALLLPIFNSVANSGRKTQVISDERNLIIACFAYKADNNKPPANPDQIAGNSNATGGADTVYGDPGQALYPNYLLLDILRAKSEPKYNFQNALNPSQTVYFDAPYVKNPNDPRHGILLTAHNDGNYILKPGTYVDPWGGEYMVYLDMNGDGDLNKITHDFYPNYPLKSDQNPNAGPKGSFQVGSLGPDGDFGSHGKGLIDGSDDIVTTQ